MEVSIVVLYIILFYILYKILDYLIRIPRINNIKQKRVFITGCDSGFGHQLALQLDKKGIQVFAGCLTEKGETELKKNCSSKLCTIPLDVTKHESIQKAYKTVKEFTGEQGLWGIVNNAGIAGKHIMLEGLNLKDYRDLMDVNLLGLIDITITFLPLIKASKGRIVNTASMAGRIAIPLSASYCLSKYGVECFSDCLRRQIRDYGVKVHLIEPGFHLTRMTEASSTENRIRQGWNEAPVDIQEEYGEEYFNSIMKVKLDSPKKYGSMNKIEGVTEAYEHALFGYFPRARYVVGKDAVFVFQHLSILPEWLSDWLLIKLLNQLCLPKVLKEANL